MDVTQEHTDVMRCMLRYITYSERRMLVHRSLLWNCLALGTVMKRPLNSMKRLYSLSEVLPKSTCQLRSAPQSPHDWNTYLSKFALGRAILHLT